MAKVAQEVVQNAGIDVNELVQKLVQAASAEFTTYYYSTIFRVNAIGFKGEGLKEIIEDARLKDRNPFEALVPRINKLSGESPGTTADVMCEQVRMCPRLFTPRISPIWKTI